MGKLTPDGNPIPESTIRNFKRQYVDLLQLHEQEMGEPSCASNVVVMKKVLAKRKRGWKSLLGAS